MVNIIQYDTYTGERYGMKICFRDESQYRFIRTADLYAVLNGADSGTERTYVLLPEGW